MGDRVWICLPTYNEAGNLERMIDALGSVVANSPLDITVLVIDDSSPDGTGDIADELASRHAFVQVLHRPGKQGLGKAYVHGFRTALDRGADYVVQMDCDFSHDPADVPRLLAATDAADVVLGSRYVDGGGVRNWPWHRRLLSRGGSLYARTVLSLPIRDLTGGFKCHRRAVLEAIDLAAVDSAGYTFQVEMSLRAVRAGFRVVEVPIVFTDRTVGESKMSGGIVFEAMWRVLALRRQR
jgi:dolichol-phosphate mannosyltransferase